MCQWWRHTYTGTQVRNMCNMHAHMCMQANTACAPAINGAIIVSPHLLLRRSTSPGRAAECEAAPESFKLRLLKNKKNTDQQIKRTLSSLSFLQGFFGNIAAAILLPSPTHTNSHIGILYTHMPQKHKPRTHQESTA